jgi:hypothetical protein
MATSDTTTTAAPQFIAFNNAAQYDIPVDPMDDLQCESCQ